MIHIIQELMALSIEPDIIQKLEKEDYDSQHMWRECQKKELRRKWLWISKKEKGPLESKERNGQTTLKMIWRMYVLEAGEE